MDKQILVFGATGNTGVEICKELESKNLAHHAFVRKGSEGKINSSFTTMVTGDVFNKKDIEKALLERNYTNIIIALGSRDLKTHNIRSIGTKHIVDVLNENNISTKLHVISAHGTRDSWNRLNWFEKLITNLFLKKTMVDHGLQENEVIKNNGGHHIIRPVALKDNPKTGEVTVKNEGKMPSGEIARADVAYFLVASLIEGKSGEDSICKG